MGTDFIPKTEVSPSADNENLNQNDNFPVKPSSRRKINEELLVPNSAEEKTEIITAKADLPSSTNEEVPTIVVEEFKESKHLDDEENWLDPSAYDASDIHIPYVETEDESK